MCVCVCVCACVHVCVFVHYLEYHDIQLYNIFLFGLYICMHETRVLPVNLKDTFTSCCNPLHVLTACYIQVTSFFSTYQGYVSRGVNGSSNSGPPSLSNPRPDSPDLEDHSDRVYNGYHGNGELPPPYLGKGSHKCQKCYRKFENKRELQDHKIRCLI